VLYFIHYLIFKDPHHIFIYLLGDIAFVPVEVLLVTLIIHRLLEFREKRERIEKLNMVIGVFFSETGTELLRRLSAADPEAGSIREEIAETGGWTEKDMRRISKRLGKLNYFVDVSAMDLEGLKSFLVSQRGFMVGLLQNPTLLEHESFTGLLRAVFHFIEEMHLRDDFASLPAADLKHLGGDMQRAYSLLVAEWMSYMKHLRDEFPFLFSLAMRTSPFKPRPSAVMDVKQ